ncbi:MAG: hypothetical protein EA372_09875, partial [Chromatiaceae bacterium]
SDGNNTWAIPVSADNQLPGFIGIQPPDNFSGTLEGLELAVISGEPGLEPRESSQEFDLVVDGVADGITLNPSRTFGNEGEKIRLNLNADIPDEDETTTLVISGLGEFASFYTDGGNTLLVWDYDGDEDKYTLEGITAEQVNDIHVLQGRLENGTISVEAFTREDESVGGDQSDTVNATFTLNIRPVNATTGDDTLLYSGHPIDALGGEDTIVLRFNEGLGEEDYANFDNIEIFDLTGSGSNTLEALRPEDVLGMTDENNVLKIRGDSEDTVSLGEGWGEPSSDNGFKTYTDGNEVTVKIQEAITIE